MKEIIIAITLVAILLFCWFCGGKILHYLRTDPGVQSMASGSDEAGPEKNEGSKKTSREQANSEKKADLQAGSNREDGARSYSEESLLNSAEEKDLSRLKRRQSENPATASADEVSSGDETRGTSINKTYDLLERIEKLNSY